MRIRTAAVLALAAAIVATAPVTAATTKKKKATKPATTKAAATTKAPAATAAPTTAAAATGGQSAAVSATLEAIKKKGKITIGTKWDVPLIGLKNPVSGEVQGFDVEMGKIIAKAIFGTDQGKVEWVEAISANRIPFIVDNKVDIILSTFSITDARKQQVDFAGPYYIAGQDLLIYKVDADTIKSVQDLNNGKKVCAQTGSTSVTNLKNLVPKAQVLDLPTTANCVEALKDGRVDAVSTDDTLLAGFAEKFNAFQLVGKQFSVEKYGVGLKKGDTDFRNYLNDVIEKSFKDGSWKKAAESTIGTGGLKIPEPPKVERY